LGLLLGYRRAKRLVIGVAAATGLAAWACAGFILWSEYHAVLGERTQSLERMREMAAEETRRMIAVNDLFLRTLDHALTHDPGDFALPVEITRMFLDFTDDRDEMVRVGVIDHAGGFRRLGGAPLAQVGDRPYMREAEVGRLVVSVPVRNRITGQWVIPLVRRVSDPANPVDVMLSAIDIDGIEKLYDSVRDPDGGAITLLRIDGTVLARAPRSQGAIGRSIADDPTFRRHAGHNDVGTDEGIVSPLDGTRRISTFRQISPYGVGVVVSLTLAAALAPWWQFVGTVAVALTLVSGLVVTSSVVVLRLLRRLEEEAATLERKVGERTLELREMMDRRRLFLASMSHELRSPLNAILGFSDALLAGVRGPLDPAPRDYVRDIHQAGGLLLGVVNDLLDSAALEAGGIRLEPETVIVRALIDDVVRMLAPAAEQAHVVIHVVVEPPGLCLVADPRRLAQVLLNLGSNAIKYGAVGGRIEIEAAPDSATGGVRLSVADHGPGLSEDEIRVALSPFGRATKGRGIEGTGLGLPLSAGLIDLHGGALRILSRPGGGTRAEVILPPAPGGTANDSGVAGQSGSMSPSASAAAAAVANAASRPSAIAPRTPRITS